MTDVVRWETVTKRYGNQTALDSLSLAVPEGVVLALLGENGAGKTTALRILLGLTTADAGRAEVLGCDSARDGYAIRREVGYVAERPALYDWMTVDEIGWFTAGFYGDGFLTRYRERARDFALPPDRRIKALSKGMQAKVVLALAMSHEPRLLILDEPTSGLDTLVRREFLEGMVDWAATGRTVLLSSHQIPEVERVADMVAILHEGKLLLVERLDELKRQVREVTLTSGESSGTAPALGGEILRQRKKGRQWQMLVRNMPQDQVHRWQTDGGIEIVDVRAPSLEEIFVAYLERPAERAPASGSVETVVP